MKEYTTKSLSLVPFITHTHTHTDCNLSIIPMLTSVHVTLMSATMRSHEVLTLVAQNGNRFNVRESV